MKAPPVVITLSIQYGIQRFFSISSLISPRFRGLFRRAWGFIYRVAIADISLSDKNRGLRRARIESKGKRRGICKGCEQNGSRMMDFISIHRYSTGTSGHGTPRKITRDERCFHELCREFSTPSHFTSFSVYLRYLYSFVIFRCSCISNHDCPFLSPCFLSINIKLLSRLTFL